MDAVLYTPFATRLRAALWMPLSLRPTRRPRDREESPLHPLLPVHPSQPSHPIHPRVRRIEHNTTAIPLHPAPRQCPRTGIQALASAARARLPSLRPTTCNRGRVRTRLGSLLHRISLLCCFQCVRVLRVAARGIMIEMTDPGDQSSSSWLQAATQHLSLTLSVAPVSRRYRPLSTRVHWQVPPPLPPRLVCGPGSGLSGASLIHSATAAPSIAISPPSDAVHISTPPATVDYSALVSSSACAALRRTRSGQGCR